MSKAIRRRPREEHQIDRAKQQKAGASCGNHCRFYQEFRMYKSRFHLQFALLNFFLSVRLQQVREHKKRSRLDNVWSDYADCKNQLNTRVPSDVRSFIYQWKSSVSEHLDQQINWWLKCNDRSVLTQEPDQKDTRRKLWKKLREPTGKFYDRKLRSMLTVYNSLMDALRRKKMTTELYEDLITVEL